LQPFDYRLENLNFENVKMSWFWRVSIARIEERNNKNCWSSIFGFQCVAINIESWLNIHSQIWLNLPKVFDHQIFSTSSYGWLQLKLQFKKLLKKPLLPWEARLFKLIIQIRIPKDNKSLLEFRSSYQT
jgi:hypothetical protein